MYIDHKTLEDLSVFHQSGGIFELLNGTTTTGGMNWLKNHARNPPQDLNEILEFQNSVKYWVENIDSWSENVNNGTLLIVDKFFGKHENIISKPTAFSLFLDRIVKVIHPNNEQSLLKFSILQVLELVKGCQYLIKVHKENLPIKIEKLIDEIRQILSTKEMEMLVNVDDNPTYKELMLISYHTRKWLKNSIRKLVNCYEVLDGMRGMAVSTLQNGWTFPELISKENLRWEVNDFYHPLLKKPISYSLKMNHDQHFLFLTGANMSGKSTLIRSIGIVTYLSHLGMSIPAHSGTISVLDSLITNMQIEDNIYAGESYFFAEVQRMKNTAQALRNYKFNMVLMDELFKGTNVHDAYDCTKEVIEAMLKSTTNLMALSTHLYEVGEDFIQNKSINFQYCETIVDDNKNFSFTYQLKPGISNDRIGYLVLKKEGVIDCLQQME